MANKAVQVELTGLSPLLMHRFPLEPIEGIEKKTKEQQAELSAYRHPDTKELFVPGVALQRAFVNGGTFVKGKGRASLQKVVAACVMIESEYLLLGTKEFVIDSQKVRIPATGGSIVRHRPKISNWKLKLILQYDDTLLSEQQMRSIVDATGSRVGLLDFRPETKGPFGRFNVTSWKVIDLAAKNAA